MGSKQKIEVYGLLGTLDFFRAKCCAEDIYLNNPDALEKPILLQMWRFEYETYLDKKRRELRGEMWHFNDPILVYVDGEVKGGLSPFIHWAKTAYNFEEFRPMPLYAALLQDETKRFISSRKCRYVYMDITMKTCGDIGRLVFELFSNKLPKTCENFERLCTGEMGTSAETGLHLSYVNTLFHRVIPNGWISGGVITLGNEQDSSTYGVYMEDESFFVRHDRRGRLGMANMGRNTNQSQFYITLQPTPWMDGKYVAFGQLVEGGDTLQKMEDVETMIERPVINIVVKECGRIYCNQLK